MNLRAASLALAALLAPASALPQAVARSCARVEVSSGAPAAVVRNPPAAAVTNSPAAAVTNVVVPSTPSFSATKILDLTFTVLFPPATEGEHVVELRVFTPDAQLYRSMAVPFARGATTNAMRQVDGYARPLPQQPLLQVSRGRSLFAAASTTLPVGGTDIVSSGLYGAWRVEAYLDGAEQRCAPATSFNLNP